MFVDEIESAILGQRRMHIFYDPGLRLIEPHVLGISSKGDLLLRAYQLSGASASGEYENWKLFRVDRIGSLDPTDETFSETRPLYNPNDPAMKSGIIARL